MKGLRGTILRKLKLIPTITNLKQGLVLPLNPPDNVFCIKNSPTPPKESNLVELGFNGIENDNKHFKEEKFSLTNLSEENSVGPNWSETKMEEPSSIIKEHPCLTEFRSEEHT